jgi:hypothetical protein
VFEATKKLIEHCKHLPQMSRVFSDPLVALAEKEIAQIESQLTQVAGDGAIAPHVCETCRHGQCPDMCASCNPPRA